VTSYAELYAAKVDAVLAQRARLFPERGERSDRWAARARFFRLDPRRELEANTAAIADRISPLDTVIDIGGGAGRVGLPVALLCSEVLNIEPSAAMRKQFEEAAREAGIVNARAIDASWPEAAAHLDADVVMTANVTYFVHDILPFLDAMDRAAERLCLVTVWTVPPPDRAADVFQIVYGEELARCPNHLDLLGCLWELDILPDVTVLPDPVRGFRTRFASAAEAIENALEAVEAVDVPGARRAIEASFDNLFRRDGDEYEATWPPAKARELLISWTPRSAAANGG
jgi:hypothetical protein